MFKVDKAINDILGKKSRSVTTPNKVQTKIDLMGELARSSIFFPFTQPTVKSPTGKIVKGRMPSMNRVMNNFGLKQHGGKNDWDGDGIVNSKDCQPRNVMRQDTYYVNNEGVFTDNRNIDHHNIWPEKIKQDYGKENRWDEPVRMRTEQGKVEVRNVATRQDFSSGLSNKNFYNKFKKGLEKGVESGDMKYSDDVTTFNFSHGGPERLGQVRDFVSGASIDKQKEWKNMNEQEKDINRITKQDLDRDNVPDEYDCQPRNAMRQDFMLKTTVPIVDYPESYGYTKRTVYMSPDDYMKKAYASHGYARSGFMSVEDYEKANIQQSNVDRIKEGLRKKEKVVPAPWLETRRGIYEDQEGRHRAVAARQLGMGKIPVHILETNPQQNLMQDTDGDGVNNMMDCCPEDASEQGPGDSPVQTLFYSGNVSPSQYLMQNGVVYGFTQLRFAEGWAKQNNYPYIYQYLTNQYQIDPKRYARRTAMGKEYSDVEYLAYNVLTEKLLTTTGKVML
jgi:hypothetical protein